MISQSENSPLFTSQSGSLISRLSRGFTSRAKHKLMITDIFSPVSTNFDSISTIKADDFLFDKHEDTWNIQHRSASPYQEGKPPSPLLAFGGKKQFSPSRDLKHIEVPSVCFRNVVSHLCVKHIDHDVVSKDPSPRRIQRMRVQGVGADTVQRISVSWEISPSKKGLVEASETEQPTEPDMIPSHASNILDETRQNRTAFNSSRHNSNKAGEDQWREAIDPESGRTYYYNRRTRVSKWRLPADAVVIKKDPRNRVQGREQTDCTDKSRVVIPIPSSIPRRNHRRAEIRKKIMHVSLSSDDDKLNTSNSSSHKEHQASYESRYLNQLKSSSQLSQSPEVLKTLLHENEANLLCPTLIEKAIDVYEMEDAGRIKPAQNDTATQLSLVYPLNSPRGNMPHFIFCLYCGCKCESVAVLSSHLSQCTRFDHIQKHGRSTQIELEIILFREWSQLGSSSSTDIVDGSSCHKLYTPSGKSSAISPEEEVTRSSIPSEKSNPAARQTPTPRNNKGLCAKPYFGIESKKCPFCSDVFGTGNGFSSHLLVCTVRRQVRKQRRTKKNNSPVPPMIDPRKKNGTPGRRMPWE